MKHRQQGLTLVELMVTLAVAIILLAVGMPLFSGIAANNRAVAEANLFLAGFKTARSEAVKRGTEVSVCAIDDPAASPLTCSADNGDWVNGLLVFTDGGVAGSVDGADARVKAFVNPTAGSNVTATTTYFRFRAQGEADQISLVTNSLCAGSGSCLQIDRAGTTGNLLTRCLYIMASGQIRLERDPCS
jgi:type IV fimbrial biogenesis protein FimT